ncbi:MAG: fasciclin domain-containing protein [Sphingobacteriales bacterium]|nr:MAG: fasciclin domain-containing protein [Sphingobacteriales bacterium]
MKKHTLSFAVAIAMTFAMVSCGNSETKTETTMTDTMTTEAPAAAPAEQGVMVGGAMMVPSKDIVDNAMGSSDHTTLVSAVKQAELVETLKGAGPFTVFAPTNAAFDKLPKGAVENLMKDENKAKLKNVLTYHVVPGALKAADLKDGQMLKTVQGEELKVSVKDGKVMINNAEVTIADVVSSNGVTHVISEVLMPKK